jgi:hypothetical protein
MIWYDIVSMTWYDMIGACNISTMLPCSMQCFQTCESSWRTVCSYCERFQGSITKCFKQHLNAFDSCSLLLHLLDELLDDQFHVSKCFVRLISWLGHFVGGFSLILEDFSHFNEHRINVELTLNQREVCLPLLLQGSQATVHRLPAGDGRQWTSNLKGLDNDCEALLGQEFYRFILIILVCLTLNRSCIRDPGEFHELDTATSNRI